MPSRIALTAALLLISAPAFACPFSAKTAETPPMTPITTAQAPGLPTAGPATLQE